MECNLSIYINYSCLPQFYTAWKPSKETIKKVKGNKGKERDKEKDKKKRKEKQSLFTNKESTSHHQCTIWVNTNLSLQCREWKRIYACGQWRESKALQLQQPRNITTSLKRTQKKFQFLYNIFIIDGYPLHKKQQLKIFTSWMW